MNIITKSMIVAFMAVFISVSFAKGETFNAISDCLVTNDIGIYTYKSERVNIGSGSGVVGATGHFNTDHNDTVCSGRYSNINQLRGLPHEEIREKLISVEVQVTQHAGVDSDKWLLHEVESSFRGREKEGWLGQGLRGSASIREISGNKIFDYGNIDYRWTSNNVVVYIHYTDLQGSKPEPLEIVQAYLQKFPSTIAMTDAEAKSRAHNEKWIKDEMERRLWLGDRWFMALQLKKAEQEEVLEQAVKSMTVFLDYREKYYGINAATEKNLLFKYQQTNNGTMIKNKLEEYKNWWTANKEKAISL